MGRIFEPYRIMWCARDLLTSANAGGKRFTLFAVVRPRELSAGQPREKPQFYLPERHLPRTIPARQQAENRRESMSHCRALVILLLIVARTAVAAPTGNARDAFGRAAEADIAIAQAESAVNAGHIDEARSLFRYACQMASDDSDVWHQAARFEVSQARYDAALQLLERALTVDRDNLPALYDRGYVNFLADREEPAKQAFAEYSARAPDDKRPEYFLGLYAFKEDQLSTAQLFFDHARAGEDTVSNYARCYYALVAAQLGQAGAKELAKQAAVSAPTPEWRAKMIAISQDAAPKVARAPWVNGRGVVDVEYDTNASLASTTAAQSPTTSAVGKPVAGFRLAADLRAVFRPVAYEPFTLELEGEFYNATHLSYRSTLAQYDNGGPSAAIRMISRFGGGKVKGEAAVDFTYRDVWFNDYKTHFLTAFGAYPSIGLIFAPRHILYAIGFVETRNFLGSPYPSDHSPYNRDSLTTMAGLLYQVPFSILELVLSAGYDQDNTQGAQYFFRGAHGNAGLRCHILDRVILYGYAAGNYRNYTYSNPSRYEIQGDFGLNVRWNIIKHLAAVASYSYLFNNATARTGTNGAYEPFNDFTYRRHLIMLGIEGYF